MSRLRAILVLFLLLTAGTLITACDSTRNAASSDDFRYVDTRRDP
jgi:hypothetical protein